MTNGGRSDRKMRRFGSVDVAADRIGDQIDVMAELAERLDAVVFAERGAARLEERLRREHQDAQRTVLRCANG